MTLARRIEKAALARFDGDKRKASRYLQDKASHFAHKSYRYSQNPLLMPYQQAWSNVYKAYSSAAFAMDYWLGVEEESLREMCDFSFLDDVSPEPIDTGY